MHLAPRAAFALALILAATPAGAAKQKAGPVQPAPASAPAIAPATLKVERTRITPFPR